MYGQVEYDIDGLPICEICGKSFKKMLSHVTQKHNLNAREYKIKYGLDVKKGICFKGTKEILQQRIKENYDLVVKDNLLNHGKETRFSKGILKGKKKSYVSEQTKQRSRERNPLKKIIINQ